MLYNKNKTFTGTDTLVFIILPKSKPILLGSLTTLSYSIYRHKTPIPLLGRISTGGCTRGTRVVAGTMIFTVINQHWINEVANHVPYISQYKKLKADELPIFDLMIISANEFGSSASAFIYGVDFTEEGGVISIEDLMMENTFSFVARDIDVFSNNDYNITEDGNQSIIDTITTFGNFPKKRVTDISPKVIQLALLNKGYNLKVTNFYDNETIIKIKEFQENNGLPKTGMIDSFTRNALFDNNSSLIINKNKEKIKIFNYNDELIDYLNYADSIQNYIIDNDKILLEDGYIYKNNIKNKNINIISNFDKEIEMDFIQMIKGYFKINITTSEPSIANIVAISIFDNDIKIYKKNFNVSESMEISSSIISEAFLYDNDIKSLPNKVEIIINVDNKKYSKFIVNRKV